MNNSDSNPIVLSYIAVHQIFQLTLAAEEIGKLDTLYCSAVDRPGKWGRYAAKFLSASMLQPLGAKQIPANKLQELPWGMVRRKIAKVLGANNQESYLLSNQSFSASVGKRLEAHHQARMFVATETCALESFQAARKLGMKCVLDCPGIPRSILADNVQRAVADLGIKLNIPTLNSAMEDRKRQEIELADHVLLCSNLQRDFLADGQKDGSELSVNPLWVDDAFLDEHVQEVKVNRNGPLKVLYAGTSSVAKGVPYLLEAFSHLGGSCCLTLCGHVDDEVRTWAGSRLSTHKNIARVPRTELARVFRDHDVLVLPSLGDSFGFIALEAMACGLPVVVTMAVGVPLPSERWRIAANCSESIREQLSEYADDRDLLASDGDLASRFAAAYTPKSYRERAGLIFSSLLCDGAPS